MPTRKVQDTTEEWISLAAAKVQCQVDADITQWDDHITRLISAVRLFGEGQCRRAFVQNTYELVSDRFTAALPLQVPRVIAVDWVRYIDEDGTEQTLDQQDYQVDADSEPGWVVPAPGRAWPATRCQPNAVRVRYRAGYGSAAAVPHDLKLWMLAHLAHHFKHREAVGASALQALPYTDNLLDPYRVWTA